ncbi:hypothetical protein PT974_02839 [Cladobotryum mycophilum]|uniref:Peroxin 11C n=1 Tax=Cladobotryum mycophilum TaxID=491253 RepID=A0ABR0SZ83_9HYPO
MSDQPAVDISAAAEAAVAAESAPVTTLPASGVLESNTPPPSLPPPAKTSFGASIAAVPAHTDAFMAHLLRCLQTRAGADVVLQFACYSARLSGSVLESLSRTALHHSAQKLVAMAFKLPPSTTVLLSSATTPPGAAVAMRIGAQLKALSGLLSEARTVNRLWGLLGLYFGLKRLALKSRAKKTDAEASANAGESQFDSLVAYTQVLVLIFYQIFENLSYLGSKKVLNISPAMQGKLAVLSVKCWGGWIGIELARLVVERSRKSGAEVKDAAWSSSWKKSFLRNLAWAPLTVHWSMPNGPLPDMAVSLLAMYPSTSQMVDLWRQTA